MRSPAIASVSPLPHLAVASALLLGCTTGRADWEAGVLVTWQSASDARIQDEFQGSADLVAEFALGAGVLAAHIEANSNPTEHGVSGLLGEVNADAGSAYNANGHGRVQLSELNYTRQAGPGTLTVGLIDATGPLDNSDVANDADTQFLATGLNNNPTIEFPDYTLGLFYQLAIGQQDGTLVLLAAASHGLADGPHARYEALFDIDEEGRGTFLAAEWQQLHGWGVTRLGSWLHSGAHEADAGHNYGVYLSVDRQLGDAMLNLRLGAAREAASEAARFASLAAELAIADKLTLGTGIAWTGAAARLVDADDNLQSELYLRWQPSARLHVSPSVQYVRNSGFDGSGTAVDASVWVAGLRAGYYF